MQNEYIVNMHAYGNRYTSHVNTDSRKVHIYRNDYMVGFGIWSSNQITDVFGIVDKSIIAELNKLLVEAMYV